MPVSVSRRIEAPAGEIFRVLADPGRHTELDGSGMLRGAVTRDVVTGVGDVFVMQMYFSEHGDYQMNNHVVEFEQDRLIGWEPAAGHGATVVTEIYDCSRVPAEAQEGMDGGKVWLAGMSATLERLDAACG
jgi:hypothetical protein